MKYAAFYQFNEFKILLIASQKGLTYCDLYRDEDLSEYMLNDPYMDKYIKIIDDFFKGVMPSYEDFDIKGTEFQMKVWNYVSHLKFGETTTYLELAKNIGSPNGSRAVGNALGKNPLMILIPCHRAVHSGGDKVGYSSDKRLKAALLLHEKNL